MGVRLFNPLKELPLAKKSIDGRVCSATLQTWICIVSSPHLCQNAPFLQLTILERNLHFNSLGAPKMHPYGLQSAKYGFFFLATAQAPHRRKKLLFIFLPQIQFVSHLSANNITIIRLPGTRSPHTHAAVLYLVQS